MKNKHNISSPGHRNNEDHHNEYGGHTRSEIPLLTNIVNICDKAECPPVITEQLTLKATTCEKV